MAKNYKITYKTYFNARLKKVSFHGRKTYPLYIQLTYMRKTSFFKSNFFELFAQEKYAAEVAGKLYGPPIDEVAKREHELINFIIQRHPDDFSLKLFKKEYDFYSRDLLELMEADFMTYLYIFFHDEGLPTFGAVLRQGSQHKKAHELVSDLKLALKKPLYEKLIKNALSFEPPYLPLYGFMLQFKKWPMFNFSIMEWQAAEMKENFMKYLKKYYSGADDKTIMQHIEKYIRQHKKALH